MLAGKIHTRAPRRKAALRSTIPSRETRYASIAATTKLWATTKSIAKAGVAALAGFASLSLAVAPPKTVYQAALATNAASAAAIILK
jgi:hypothetical protein